MTDTFEADGRRVVLSNLDKTLWPEAGFTKGDLIAYYVATAPALVPHVSGRALTLRRFPDGVEAASWYQTLCRGHPAWLATKLVPGRDGAVYRMCVVDDLPSLVWVANLGTIELHPFLARGDDLDRPTAVVFDLDPGPPADIVDCCEVALRLRDALGRERLESFPKTSGSVGLHVYVPLNTPHGYEETKGFARSVARRLAAGDDRVVETMSRAARRGKVLVDWPQNDAARSTVSAYSLRGTAFPTVSTPVTWEEVEQALAERRPELLTFLAEDVLERVQRLGDIFAPVLELKQSLPR